MKSRLAVLLFTCLALPACSDDEPDWSVGDGPLARVNGRAFIFGPNPENLTMMGATIAAAEAPEYSTTAAADGTFSLEVPSGAPISFSLTKAGFHPNQSAAIDIGPDGVAMLGFQAPTLETFAVLGSVSNVTPDPERCQVSTTISRLGTEPFGGDALGVEGAIATLSPSIDASSGPIYFAYLGGGVIIPDRALTEASIDGGAIFANVPVGEYTLTATKEGHRFSKVKIRCRAGVLVNAAPPNGIQELPN